ncbi:ATP-binding protein [Patescibacteria group bacterium]|nr:ATP-binding protein [Patescibacteria group bacterium]
MIDETSNLTQEIIEGLDPNIITALYKNFTNQYIAIEELIDNAIDDRIVGKTLTVNIYIDNEKITISNLNGKGMDHEDLVSFFQWGKSSKTSKIGRFGQGGKAALGYLCKSWTLRTKAINSKYEYFIEIENWEDRSKGLKHIAPKVMSTLRSSEESIVKFELRELKRDIDYKKLINELKEIYRPLIINHEVNFFVNDIELDILPVNYDEGTLTSFKDKIPIGDSQYEISGEYGIVSDTKSLRGGIRCYQYNRLIIQNEYFGHSTPHARWALERLSGDLYIDFPVDLLMNKTNVNRDSEEWKAISTKMYDELKGIIRQLQEYREPSTHEKRIIIKMEKELKKIDERSDISFEFTNYGKTILFKTKGDGGKIKLLINREFPAYQLWGKSPFGEKLYIIMIYSLFEASEKLSKKEASILISTFTESLMRHSLEYEKKS